MSRDFRIDYTRAEKREQELEAKLKKLNAKVSCIEATTKRILQQRDASLAGNGAERLLEVENKNMDLERDRAKLKQKLRNQNQRYSEMRNCVDNSKTKVQRLLTERHLLVRKVGELEDTVKCSPYSNKSRLNKPTPRDPAMSIERIKSILDKTKTSIHNKQDTELEISHKQCAANSDSKLTSALVPENNESENTYPMAKLQAALAALSEYLTRIDLHHDSSKVTSPSSNFRKKVQAANSKVLQCQQLCDELEQQQCDELKLLRIAESRICDLHNRLITLKEENTKFKLQLQEFDSLKASFHQQADHQRALEHELERVQERCLANSYRAVEEISNLKQSLRESQLKQQRVEKREKQLRYKLHQCHKSQDDSLSTGLNPMTKETERLRLENQKLKIELEAMKEKLDTHCIRASYKQQLYCNENETRRDLDNNKSFIQTKSELQQLRKVYLMDQDRIEKMTKTMLEESTKVQRLQTALQEKQQQLLELQSVHKEAMERIQATQNLTENTSVASDAPILTPNHELNRGSQFKQVVEVTESQEIETAISNTVVLEVCINKARFTNLTNDKTAFLTLKLEGFTTQTTFLTSGSEAELNSRFKYLLGWNHSRAIPEALKIMWIDLNLVDGVDSKTVGTGLLSIASILEYRTEEQESKYKPHFQTVEVLSIDRECLGFLECLTTLSSTKEETS